MTPPLTPVPVRADDPVQVTIWFDEFKHKVEPVDDDRLFNATVELNVDDPVTPKVFKFELPVTFNPFNAPKPVIDPPTPTLPVVVRVVALMLVAFKAWMFDSPVTFNPPLATVKPVVINDDPTPTLPVTLSDDPIPTKPVKCPVPETSKVY